MSNLGKSNLVVTALSQLHSLETICEAVKKSLSDSMPILYIGNRIDDVETMLHGNYKTVRYSDSIQLTPIDMQETLVLATPSDICAELRLMLWDCIIFDNCVYDPDGTDGDLRETAKLLYEKYIGIFDKETMTVLVNSREGAQSAV